VATFFGIMSTTTMNPERLAPTSAADARRELRPIDGIYPAPRKHWVGDGFYVAGYFSAIPEAARKLDPFLLLDYHPTHEYPPSEQPRGVGVHPHRGFETVTIAWQGSVAHNDSTGAGGVIGPGDVQWMTAASGILHKEFHEEAFSRAGGQFQMAQLWVNLPKANKMDAPGYQALTADAMGLATLPEGAGDVRVIAGEFRGVRGPARTHSPIQVFDVRLRAGGAVDLPLPAKHNAAILVMAGEVRFNGTTQAAADDFVLFKNAGSVVAVEATADAQLLVLSGEPLNEPIVQYGPFVMNTEREIVQAFADFRAGRFGRLDE
jgi:hypothetical protein